MRRWRARRAPPRTRTARIGAAGSSGGSPRRIMRPVPATGTSLGARLAAARWPSTTSSSVAARPRSPALRTRLSRSPDGPGTSRPASRSRTSTRAWFGRVEDRCSAIAPAIERSSSIRPPPRTSSRSQACSMSVMTWDDNSAVAPSARTASTRTCRNSRRASGSRLASGSSSSRTGARAPNASASPTCACCPPDSSSAREVCGMARSSSRRRRCHGSKPGRSVSARSTCSSTVSSR